MSVELSKEEYWLDRLRLLRALSVTVLVLMLVSWVVWLVPFDDLLDRSGTPLGGDFVMLYAAGQVVSDQETSTLYDDQQNLRRTNAVFDGALPDQSWPYRYPPTVALCMAPLSELDFGLAWLLFLGFQLLCLAAASVCLRAYLGAACRWRNWLVWIVIGSPVMLETLIGGQLSVLALAAASAFLVWFRRHQDIPAGAMLALTMYKPNVLLLFVVGCLIIRPRLLLGFLPTVALGWVVTWVAVGPESLMQYLSVGSQLATTTWSLETPFAKVHGLAPLFQLASPDYGRLSCLLSGALLAVVFAVARRRGWIGCNTLLGSLLVVNCLFNPYVPIYDLVLLLPLGVLAYEAIRQGEVPQPGSVRIQLCVLLGILGPHLSQAVAPQIGIQLFPVCVAGVFMCFAVQLGTRLIVPSTGRLAGDSPATH